MLNMSNWTPESTEKRNAIRNAIGKNFEENKALVVL
jgi:hypothetical protein